VGQASAPIDRADRPRRSTAPIDRMVTVRPVRVLLAMDVQWLVDDIVAALDDGETSFTVCSEGRQVSSQVAAVANEGGAYDLAIVDLQIGSMGGVAVTMALRLDATSGRVPAVPVLLLLDRVADVQLARRCGADGWLIKPLDALRLRRAARAVASGSSYTEHLAEPEVAEPHVAEAEVAEAEVAEAEVAEPAGSEPVAAG
jgi:DNA-binding response OmpR family regulator